ncbi:uncharacterized protein J4E92_003600 [Alternaria infectoria]|uniref:uncharacterized protein n=1 Tax=Alternaria infectoria TaxID=45303 RepID=UPI0022207660|nr:uncharacterized protein J4E92_003600 [Alternaria infectoria]KAI4933930.1 hypothetical protein J4E92_003600 [Alternaria infectoria]
MEKFDWKRADLNWIHFHSLANLLSLRNGGQVEPTVKFDTEPELDLGVDDEEDEDSRSVNTALANQISESGHGKLKKRFLDAVAGFAANKKGGTAVACSAMKEAENDVVIWLARNDGFSNGDRPVFEKLGEILSSLSYNGVQDSQDLLWEHMVSYHSSRIKQDYIPKLRRGFEAYDAEQTQHATNTTAARPVVDAALSALRDILLNDLPSDTSTFDKHTKLIVASYDLRREAIDEEALNSRASSTLGSRKLWSSIYLFSRVRVAYRTFIEIAQTLPSFGCIKFVLVSRPAVSLKPPQRPATLKQTLGMLKLDFNSNITKELLGNDWKVSKTEERFKSLQKQNLNVHAEVQMLIALAANESVKSDLFPYFGCSKLSCFMCSRFIQAYGRFTTRGCHGHLFKPWTVPNTDGLLPGQPDRIAKALVAVQNELKKKLKESIKEDLIPEEEEVLEDFGFNSVEFGQGRSYLFGVYAGLYRSGRFSAEDFHNWRIEGILTEKIKEFFYSLPEDSRGGYFPWFLENLPVLETPTTKQQATQNLVASMFAKARPYLDNEDRNKALDELMPEAKRDSFTLLAQLSHQMSPNPIEQNWYSFGFVTCRGKSEENTLVQVYQLLLLEDDGSYFYKFYNSRRDHNSPVGLTQFWKAYEAGTLIQLMDSKGLKNLRSRLPLLEVFLSGSCSSVWDLKWFLDIEDPVKYPPIPSVSLDYGFVNCNTLEETYTLIEIYKRVLQTAHLLDLQHACITGTLWQFASSRIRMEEKWRPLMKKVYSLETPTVSETGEDMTPKAESEGHGEPVVVSSSLLSRLWGSLSVV